MTDRRDVPNPPRSADEIALPWDCRPASGWAEFTEARARAIKRLRGEVLDEVTDCPIASLRSTHVTPTTEVTVVLTRRTR